MAGRLLEGQGAVMGEPEDGPDQECTPESGQGPLEGKEEKVPAAAVPAGPLPRLGKKSCQ